MIPNTLRMTITCDCCGDTSRFDLSKDDIDSQGIDQVLETALIDGAWAVRYPLTICPRCVDKIIEEGLRKMEEEMEMSRLYVPVEVSDDA